MKRPRDLLFLSALGLLGVSAAVYALLAYRWTRPRQPAARAQEGPGRRAAPELEEARRAFRAGLLSPAAHLRLAEALRRAGRPADAFYVALYAKSFFPAEEFSAAHAEVVLARSPERALALAQARSLAEPAARARALARAAREGLPGADGRDALEELLRQAQAEPRGGSLSGRPARGALEDLHRADPRDPEKLAAFGLALLFSGDAEAAEALAAQALSEDPRSPGAARLKGALALRERKPEAARGWLERAWSADPQDLYAAEKLARLHEQGRGDPDEALPYWLALYRQNPWFEGPGGPLELRVRQIFDARRERILKGVSVGGLGRYLSLDDASLRAQACVLAGEFQDARWADELGRLLDDDAEFVRHAADYALFRLVRAHPEAARARRGAWLASPSAPARLRALNLFADLDPAAAWPAVRAALKDPDPAVRALAKVRIVDAYYTDFPEAAAEGAAYAAGERDPRARALLARAARKGA